jgi:hypothetical protein
MVEVQEEKNRYNYSCIYSTVQGLWKVETSQNATMDSNFPSKLKKDSLMLLE